MTASGGPRDRIHLEGDGLLSSRARKVPFACRPSRGAGLERQRLDGGAGRRRAMRLEARSMQLATAPTL